MCHGKTLNTFKHKNNTSALYWFCSYKVSISNKPDTISTDKMFKGNNCIETKNSFDPIKCIKQIFYQIE